QRVGLAGAVGDQVAVLGGLGVQVALGRVVLVGGVDQERVHVGGDCDALGVQVGDQVGPARVAVGVQLPGPPQPVAERGGALAGPVLQPDAGDLGAGLLQRGDRAADLLGAALDADDRALPGPAGQLGPVGAMLLAGDELGGGVGGDQLGAQVGGLDLQPDLVGGAGVGHGERVRLGQVRVQAHTAQVLGHPGGPGSVRHLFGAAGAVVGDVGQQGERLLPAA